MHYIVLIYQTYPQHNSNVHTAAQDWLHYKARVYFVKADHNSLGFLDKSKVRRLDNRLAAELGVKPLCDAELVQALKDRHGQSLRIYIT